MGYPYYNEIQDERARRKMQEKERGRQQVLRDMAEGLVDRINKELGIHSALIIDRADDGDFRKWEVWTELKGGIVVEEKFLDFPTDELRAKIMLTGKSYDNTRR